MQRAPVAFATRFVSMIISSLTFLIEINDDGILELLHSTPTNFSFTLAVSLSCSRPIFAQSFFYHALSRSLRYISIYFALLSFSLSFFSISLFFSLVLFLTPSHLRFFLSLSLSSVVPFCALTFYSTFRIKSIQFYFMLMLHSIPN